MDIVRHGRKQAWLYDAASPLSQLGGAIIAKFRADVEVAGARFYMVHLPGPKVLAAAAGGRPMLHAGFLEALENKHTVIRPDAELRKVLKSVSLAELEVDGHYSAAGDDAIGRVVAAQLLGALQGKAPGPRPSVPVPVGSN